MRNLIDYDQFLFEESRKMIFRNRGNAEITSADSDIIDAITEWIDQKTPPHKADKIGDFLNQNRDRIKGLMKTKPEIYAPPFGDVCYRGLEKVSNMEQVIDLVSKGRFKQVKAPGYEGMISAIKIENYDYSPRRLAQSWSIDPDVPWRFSNSGIILEAEIDGDFIMNPSYTSNINKTINRSGPSEGLTEEEVIHLGKKYKKVTLYIDIGSVEDDSPLFPFVKDL
jgi:hypothetical protein